jgi:hypothetical protein
VPAATTGANGSTNDAHVTSGAAQEANPEPREHEAPPAPGQHPAKDENS